MNKWDVIVQGIGGQTTYTISADIVSHGSDDWVTFRNRSPQRLIAVFRATYVLSIVRVEPTDG